MRYASVKYVCVCVCVCARARAYLSSVMNEGMMNIPLARDEMKSMMTYGMNVLQSSSQELDFTTSFVSAHEQ